MSGAAGTTQQQGGGGGSFKGAAAGLLALYKLGVRGNPTQALVNVLMKYGAAWPWLEYDNDYNLGKRFTLTHDILAHFVQYVPDSYVQREVLHGLQSAVFDDQKLLQALLAIQFQTGPGGMIYTGPLSTFNGDPLPTPGAVIGALLEKKLQVSPQGFERLYNRYQALGYIPETFWVEYGRPLAEMIALAFGASEVSYSGAAGAGGGAGAAGGGAGAAGGTGAGATGAGGASAGGQLASGAAASGGGGTLTTSSSSSALTAATTANTVSNATNTSNAAAAAQAASSTSSIVNSIESTVKDIQSAIGPIFDDIKSGIDSVTKVVNDVNSNLIQPIVGPIQTIIQESQAVHQFIEGDFHNGIMGLLQFPADLSGALSTVDASFQRALLQLNAGNADLVNSSLIPGLSDGMLGAAQYTTANLDSPLNEESGRWVPPIRDHLGEPVDVKTTVDSAKAAIAQLWSQDTLVSRIMKGLFSLLDSAEIVIAPNSIYIDLIKEAARMQLRPTRLDPSTALRLWSQGTLDESSLNVELQATGYDDTRIKALKDGQRTFLGIGDVVNLYKRQLLTVGEALQYLLDLDVANEDATRLLQAGQSQVDPGTLIAWWQRGLMNDTDLATAFLEQGYTSGLVERLKAASFTLPSLDLLLRAYDRQDALKLNPGTSDAAGQVPAGFAAAAGRLGLDADTAKLAWADHFVVLPPSMAVQSYFRGFINKTQLTAFLRAAGISEDQVDNWVDSLRPELGYRVIPTLMAQGIISEPEADAELRRLGYSDTDVAYLLQLHKTTHTVVPGSMADELHGATSGMVVQLYDAGSLSRAEATQLLTNLGLGTEAVTLLLDLQDVKATAAAHTAETQVLVGQALAGQITREQVASELHTIGLTTTQVNKALAQVDRAGRTRAKLPSEAELFTMYEVKVIDEPTLTDTLRLLGYSATWAQRLVAAWKAKHGNP